MNIKRVIFGLCLAASGVVTPFPAHTENWAQTGALPPHPAGWAHTGVDVTEYDKNNILRSSTSPDVFSMWFRESRPGRVGGKRKIGDVYYSEIDCYEREIREINAWFEFEDGSRAPIHPPGHPKQSSGFGDMGKLFDSTVCKQANKFYKYSDPPKWYEFWKR